MVTEREAWDAQAATYAAAQQAVWAEDDTRYLHRILDCLGELWPRLAVPDDIHGTILDLGCGVGRLAIPVAQALTQAQLIGVDVSPRMVDYARQAAHEACVPNAAFVLCDGRDLSVLDLEPVSAAFSVLLFQHLPGDACVGYIQQVAALLEPGSRFVFQYVEGSEDIAMSRQRDEATVRGWCSDAGLSVVDITPGFVVLYPEWRWVTAERR